MTEIVLASEVRDELAPADPTTVSALYAMSDALRDAAYRLEVAQQRSDVVMATLREAASSDPALATSDMDRWQRVAIRGIVDEVRARLQRLRAAR